jgi:hypothetical protein
VLYDSVVVDKHSIVVDSATAKELCVKYLHADACLDLVWSHCVFILALLARYIIQCWLHSSIQCTGLW